MQVLLARTLQTRDRENPGRLVSASGRPNGGTVRAGKVGPRLRVRRTGAISDSHRDDESVSVSFFLRSPAHKHPSLSLPQTPRFRFSRRQDGRREAAQGDARPTERSFFRRPSAIVSHHHWHAQSSPPRSARLFHDLHWPGLHPNTDRGIMPRMQLFWERL